MQPATAEGHPAQGLGNADRRPPRQCLEHVVMKLAVGTGQHHHGGLLRTDGGPSPPTRRPPDSVPTTRPSQVLVGPALMQRCEQRGGVIDQWRGRGLSMTSAVEERNDDGAVQPIEGQRAIPPGPRMIGSIDGGLRHRKVFTVRLERGSLPHRGERLACLKRAGQTQIRLDPLQRLNTHQGLFGGPPLDAPQTGKFDVASHSRRRHWAGWVELSPMTEDADSAAASI